MFALLALARSMIARSVTGAGGRAIALGGGGGLAGSALGSRLFGDEEVKKRRRRKRVFTASDRADISFITATLGSPSGKAVAMIIAARA
jgi:hypothetical protein